MTNTVDTIEKTITIVQGPTFNMSCWGTCLAGSLFRATDDGEVRGKASEPAGAYLDAIRTVLSANGLSSGDTPQEALMALHHGVWSIMSKDRLSGRKASERMLTIAREHLTHDLCVA